MYEQIISARDEGQRMDKYLHKLLPEAGTSFLYKMMRKKNITLNDKKAQGSEKLVQGDSIKIYFSNETLNKFMGDTKHDVAAVDGKTGTETEKESSAPKKTAAEKRRDGSQAYMQETMNTPALQIKIIFENDHVLFINKPAGVLSQKARPEDYSANDWLLDCLRDHENLTEEEIRTFRPCVCNRLDRNTSGLLLCAKSIKGAQYLSEALKQRTIEKYYLALVKGQVAENMHLKGYLTKDEKTNTVTVSAVPVRGGAAIETSYEVLKSTEAYSLLKVHLLTGKSHQIRAHLASIGHPLIGDGKYGDNVLNRAYCDQYGIAHQMLHAWQVRFPETAALLGIAPGETYTADIPQNFREFL